MARMVLGSMLLACACAAPACPEPRREHRRPSRPPASRAPAPGRDGSPSVHVEMRDVLFQMEEGIAMHIRHLTGRLVPPPGSDRVDFGRPEGMVLSIDTAEIAVTPASLTRLMNRYVFTGEKAPIGDVSVEIAGTRLRQHGKLRRGPRLPFTIEASVSVAPDGRMRMHPEKVQMAGVGVTHLMDLLNLTMEEVVHAKDLHGVEIDGDDVLLDPQRLLPPPPIRGRVRRVRVEPGALVQTFGGEPPPSILRQPAPPGGYMYFLGSELNFGNLTMHGADMLIWDADPHDSFHFFQRRYMRQLVAGFSETTVDQGLRVAMPDYDEAARGAIALRGPAEAALAARSSR